MSLLIILLVGASIGWLASIVQFADRARDVLANVVVGVIGAFVFGVMASSVSLLAGVTAETLLAAAIGAGLLLVVVGLAAHRPIRLPGSRHAGHPGRR